MPVDHHDRSRERCFNCERERLRDELRPLWHLVTNPNAPGTVLDDISYLAPPLLLERIAENPQALPAMLERLARHQSAEVRSAVAENPNTPRAIVYMLAQDPNPDVRYSIAENHNAPVESLESLVKDENPYVVHRARMTLQRLGLSELHYVEFGVNRASQKEAIG